MNLLGIEMVLLVLGIIILTWAFVRIFGGILEVFSRISDHRDWHWNTVPLFVLIVIGIILIIISQNI